MLEANCFRLKYFRLVLSVEDNSEDIEDKWTPVIDMKAFREACFHGKFTQICLYCTFINSCIYRYTRRTRLPFNSLESIIGILATRQKNLGINSKKLKINLLCKSFATDKSTVLIIVQNWVKDLLEEPGEEPPSSDHVNIIHFHCNKVAQRYSF